MKNQRPILIITAGGSFPWIIINAIAAKFPNTVVLQENPESKILFVRRKARMQGWFQAIGQFFTMALSKFGKILARQRIANILEQAKVDMTPNSQVPIFTAPSVNSLECRERISELNPQVVMLISCRLLRAKTLDAITCPVLNYHPGITPAYRGMWGGYWARAFGDVGNYGSTIHLVDSGIDTGDVIYQVRTTPSPAESIFTDAFTQAAEAREVVVAAIGDAVDGKLAPKPSHGPSRQHYHPPIWGYLWRGLRHRIW